MLTERQEQNLRLLFGPDSVRPGSHRLTARDREAGRALLDEWARLRCAIVAHRSRKADDRCVEDDDRLYEALGDGVGCDRRVGSKEEMLRNCARYIDRRCEGGGWPTYAELEAEVERLRGEVDRLTTEALRYYRADGSYEVLGSAAEVVARRRAAAARLAALEAAAREGEAAP